MEATGEGLMSVTLAAGAGVLSSSFRGKQAQGIASLGNRTDGGEPSQRVTVSEPRSTGRPVPAAASRVAAANKRPSTTVGEDIKERQKLPSIVRPATVIAGGSRGRHNKDATSPAARAPSLTWGAPKAGGKSGDLVQPGRAKGVAVAHSPGARPLTALREDIPLLEAIPFHAATSYPDTTQHQVLVHAVSELKAEYCEVVAVIETREVELRAAVDEHAQLEAADVGAAGEAESMIKIVAAMEARVETIEMAKAEVLLAQRTLQRILMRVQGEEAGWGDLKAAFLTEIAAARSEVSVKSLDLLYAHKAQSKAETDKATLMRESAIKHELHRQQLELMQAQVSMMEAGLEREELLEARIKDMKAQAKMVSINSLRTQTSRQANDLATGKLTTMTGGGLTVRRDLISYPMSPDMIKAVMKIQELTGVNSASVFYERMIEKERMMQMMQQQADDAKSRLASLASDLSSTMAELHIHEFSNVNFQKSRKELETLDVQLEAAQGKLHVASVARLHVQEALVPLVWGVEALLVRLRESVPGPAYDVEMQVASVMNAVVGRRKMEAEALAKGGDAAAALVPLKKERRSLMSRKGPTVTSHGSKISGARGGDRGAGDREAGVDDEDAAAWTYVALDLAEAGEPQMASAIDGLTKIEGVLEELMWAIPSSWLEASKGHQAEFLRPDATSGRRGNVQQQAAKLARSISRAAPPRLGNAPSSRGLLDPPPPSRDVSTPDLTAPSPTATREPPLPTFVFAPTMGPLPANNLRVMMDDWEVSHELASAAKQERAADLARRKAKMAHHTGSQAVLGGTDDAGDGRRPDGSLVLPPSASMRVSPSMAPRVPPLAVASLSKVSNRSGHLRPPSGSRDSHRGRGVDSSRGSRPSTGQGNRVGSGLASDDGDDDYDWGDDGRPNSVRAARPQQRTYGGAGGSAPLAALATVPSGPLLVPSAGTVSPRLVAQPSDAVPALALS